ncbi:EAL domain-containing protein [Enterobacter sp. 22325]|uniref:EAL domain-containing protein n=1 Tax=Enterobacter sp. 22325 TaxID=3453911 RepID=UPI003F82A01A
MEGVRLQPLVNLFSAQLMGYEVLAIISKGIDPETFFRTFSAEICLSQFFDQMDIVTRHKKEETLYFLNLPVRVLADPECINRLIQVRQYYRRGVVIELQDPAELVITKSSVAEAIVRGVNTLRCNNWQVWLDDMTYGICCFLSKTSMKFDGVKIDRKELGNYKQYPQLLAELIKQARNLVAHGENNILIEGIETDDDLAYARKSGAKWGQGWLWQEKKIQF